MDIGYLGLTALGFGLEDYQKMFDLTEEELGMRILDFRAGASAFAAHMHQRQGHVVATDPIYQKSEAELKQLVHQAKYDLLAGKTQEQYRLGVPDLEHFIEVHETNVEDFLSDYALGKQEGRYVEASIPKLPFEDEAFDLALVSHYLFTYTDELTLDFHLQALTELVRVANEVRIYPLVTHDAKLSDYLGQVIAQCQSNDIDTELKSVDYQLQQKGNAMLRIWSPSCTLEKHQKRESS